jgi:CubicO group peptidase (beta-lactamase class C family)
LPLLPANFGNKEVDVKNPYSAYTYKDLYDFIKEYRNTEPFGDKYAYSHIGYALLTKIIEALSKADYETVLANEITKNWNMPDTKIHLSAENTKRLAQGYSRSQQPTVAWTYQCFEGAMGLKSTADDLLNFLERHLTDATLWDMQQARFIQKQKKSFNTAIGWFLMKPQKKVYDIVLHSGHTSGHRAYIAFVRETQTAVVVLANSEEEINDLPIMLLKMLNDNWKRKQ